ncbi:thioesterase family protein [Streptomyces buecherae]|uniref:thioesterase family protein n=1 Tax=Streptomyces buecherae TaxID=2763006 RepID=UPI001C277A32|nr:thioesterase family protein [Streptomyces buecherae]
MAQATIGNSEFDRDTTVTRRAPGTGSAAEPGAPSAAVTATFDADLSARWSILKALNGGYLLAVLGRALGDTLPHPDPFSITAHYLTASQPGPAVIRTETVRAGRTLSTGQASLVQFDDDGAEVERIRVLATYGHLDALPNDVRTAATPPAMPPYEHCLGADDAPDGEVPLNDSSEIVDRFDMRLDPATAGWAIGQPSGVGDMRAWFGLADGRDPDPLSLLLAVDALPPTAFDLGLSGWVPTVELTAHVRRRPAPGRLRVAITTRNLAGGFLEEDVQVWDSADQLVAQARQLARVKLG